MNFPGDLKYTKDHEWLRLDGNEAYVGITDFAQRELGDIVFLDINTVGQEIGEGDLLGTIEAVKTVSDLFMPVTGVVVEINNKLESAPELVNSDPYGDGWMVRIAVESIAQVGELLSAEQYKELVGV